MSLGILKRIVGLALAAMFLCAGSARASDFYYANTLQGGNTGAGCPDAWAWNDGTNGLNVSAKQSPGNTFHLCGTITLGTAATFLTFVNNGSPGNPITLKWETGAILEATYFNVNGGIVMDSRSFIVIDGGTNGIMRNIADGDQLSNQQQTDGVHGSSCTSCTIKNVNFKNFFVHTAPVTITSITGNGTTATVTCAATCGLVSGEKFHVSNNANAGFNGDWVVGTTSGTTLTYANTTNATGAGGSLGCSFGPSPACIDHTFLNAVVISGSNNLVTLNTADMCGWCIKDAYGNLDDSNTFSFNEVSNFDHAFTYATSNSNTNSTNVFMFGNKIHDAASYDTPNCSGHHDGLHTFGSAASNYGYSGFFFHDNYLYGNWGNCSTAAIFIEGGSNAHAGNQAFWNNVVAPTYGAGFVNTNGWFSVFSGVSGSSTQIYHNTVKLAGTADLTVCYNIGSTNNTTFKNNVCYGAGGHGNFGNFTGTTVIDYNQWDTKNDAGGNCWIVNGSFSGCTFATYKSTCAAAWAGCEAHSREDTYPLALNSDGSPQSGFTGITWGDNLESLATGNLAGLANDTSLGGTRTPFARPPSATCSSQGSLPCSDIGAFQLSAGSPSPPPVPPASLVIASAVPLPSGLIGSPVITGISPTKTYVTKNGCSQEGQRWVNPCVFRIFCSNCDGNSLLTFDGTAVKQSFLPGEMDVTVPLTLMPVPTQITVHSFAATNPVVVIPPIT